MVKIPAAWRSADGSSTSVRLSTSYLLTVTGSFLLTVGTSKLLLGDQVMTAKEASLWTVGDN